MFISNNFAPVKFSEKYSQLSNPETLEEMVVSTIYTTMALEDQTVKESFIIKTVRRILKRRKRYLK